METPKKEMTDSPPREGTEAWKINELQEIKELWQSGDQNQRSFLEGRALEITRGMFEHPEGWDIACYCDTCRSYG